jgi:hypothetical protein
LKEQEAEINKLKMLLEEKKVGETRLKMLKETTQAAGLKSRYFKTAMISAVVCILAVLFMARESS